MCVRSRPREGPLGRAPGPFTFGGAAPPCCVPTDAGDEHQPRTPVNLWWAAYVGSRLVTHAAERSYAAAEAPPDIVSATELLVAAEVFDIIAAALAIRFVHRLTAMQCAAAASRPPASLVPPFVPAPVPGKDSLGGSHR
ncbi:DUF4328 domain-containing protein [Streptomyces sp. V1I6]|uniref:DUF4328 domain-containing protein n=1 Tax=Streptomyces sp. V1I6 TaxID=3042273 RepID=UPI0027D8EF5F|nr:DUF4328 domain-containing protein [Streptomyces sp. V1I6]